MFDDRKATGNPGRITCCGAQGESQQQFPDEAPGHVALLMAYYNFVRPHSALRFGRTMRTPAMQGGLAKNRLSFREVFTSRAAFLLFVLIAIRFYATVDCRQNSTTVA